MAAEYVKPTRLHPGDRALSSRTWNGFVELYEDKYRRTGLTADPFNRPIPPMLQNSSIALAVWSDRARNEVVGAYKPVRIIEVKTQKSSALNLLTYVVEPVEYARDGDATSLGENLFQSAHEGYAFTMAEGMSDEGGRIVIGGMAIAAIENDWQTDAASRLDGDRCLGGTAQGYYCVDDRTLTFSSPAAVTRAVGHFKIVSHILFDDQDGGGVKFNNDSENAKFLLLDMEKDCGSFRVYVPTDLVAATKFGDVEVDGGETWEALSYLAYASYLRVTETDAYNPDGDQIAFAVEDECRVYNFTGQTIPAGHHTATYSRVYNRFIIVPEAGSQTVKIGKADADIAADSTGTVSIWRDGVDTTENVTGVKLDWMHGGTQVSAGKEVMITFFADEGIWRITGAECE